VGLSRPIERGGRRWIVRSYRFSWPPWRAFWPEAEVGDFIWQSPLSFAINLVFAPITLFLIPLVLYPLEVGGRGLYALVTDERWVSAAAEGEPHIRMTWLTDDEHEEAVVDQIARQLELGYSKIEPHRAHFLGFGQ
jgi:hypothetical protein